MFPEDQLRVAIAIISSIPLSFLLYKLPNATIRKYYSLLLGVLLQYYVYGYQVCFTFALHCLIYIIVTFKRKHCGFVVTFIAVLLLSIYHIYRLIVDYGGWTFDISTILMGSVCKYSLFAYSYQDGAVSDDQLKTSDQRKQKIKQLPSIIDFLSYCIFLPNCVVVTPISYYRYSLYINKEGQFLNVSTLHSLIKLGKDTLLTVIFIGVHVFGFLYFPTTAMTDSEFSTKGFWYLLYFPFLNMFFTNQFKYFFGFKLCALPLHASGVSYQPSKEKEDQFLGMEYMDIKSFVTSSSPQTRINSWNLPVQQWLRKCIYQRLNTQKQTAKLLTFLFSAFWHGFYGGYYIAFTIFFVELQLANLAYKLSKNESHPLMKLYNSLQPISHYLLWIVMTFLFYHNAHYFPLLSSSQSWAILKRIYFVPVIVVLLAVGTLTVWKVGKPKEKAQKQS